MTVYAGVPKLSAAVVNTIEPCPGRCLTMLGGGSHRSLELFVLPSSVLTATLERHILEIWSLNTANVRQASSKVPCLLSGK